MKRLFSILAAAAGVAVLPMLPVSAVSPRSATATNAIVWLHTQQSADGTIAGNASRTEETVWGLVANDASVANFSTSGKTTIDSLRSHIGDEEKTAGNIGSLVMAVSAAGLNPTDFAGRNLLQDLQCTYEGATGVYNTQLFNDALAILALPNGAAPAKAVDFLAGQQQPDGGWQFGAGYGSDTNTTALVVMALVSANGLTATAKTRALGYFKTQQRPSGGFEYAAGSGDSDPNSDATVMEALLATGQDPTSAAWSVADKTALTDLLTFQFSNGGFGFSRPGSSSTAAPDAFSTTQSLPALASAFLPVRRSTGVMPSTCPATTSTTGTPSATPRPAPTAAPASTRRLAQTGSPLSPAVPALLGLMMVVLGWRLWRRAD